MRAPLGTSRRNFSKACSISSDAATRGEIVDERGHDGVADGLDQRAAVALDDAEHDVEVIVHELEGGGVADVGVELRRRR